MSDISNKPGQAGESSPVTESDLQQAADAPAQSDVGQGEVTAADPKADLQAQLEAAQAEAAQHKDAFLRAHAEAENTRKRAEREVANARKFALESFANELLGVCDSLELGLDAAGHASADVAKLKEGMELTHRQLLKVFENHRVVVIDPMGEAFNPEHHQAISTQESAEHKPNTVMSVLQKGYRLNERVLRPAMVIVARAPAGDGKGQGGANGEGADGTLQA